MTRRTTKLLVGAFALALAATGCGRDSGGGSGGSTGGDGKMKTDFGVTTEPCKDTPNLTKGCIYLGSLSDLTSGPFKALAVPITEAQKKFWEKTNKAGGLDGWGVDVTTYVRDNKYNPEIQKQVYQEIKPKILGLAQTLGSPTTAAIIADLKSSKIVSSPASWTSAWAFEDVIIETAANYCAESMNSVDYAVEELKTKSVMAVHYAGDYGDDAAAGAKIAAEKNGLAFEDVETPSGQDNQAGAVQAIVSKKPDLIILTTGPTDAAVIIGQAAAKGYTGKFIGTAPSWNPGLLKSPAAAAIKALYLQSSPVEPFGADTPGHKAMRETLGSGVTPNDGYTAGWGFSYSMKAVLSKAIANNDLTRAGVLAAVKQIDKVDFEGMLPEGAGNYAANANDGVTRSTVITKIDETAPTGTVVIKKFFTGPTAKDYKFEKPCFQN